jgi:opacity protein-like surface antigen
MTREPRHTKAAAVSSLLLFLALSAAPIFSGEAAQDKEAKAESCLSQGDIFYLRGDYQKAVEQYLAAAEQAERRMSLSRAYFGLSLCHYYLRDLPSSRKWLKKVFEVDPQKEISVLFYPEAFVKLFSQAKQEAAGAGSAREQKEPGPPPVKTEPKVEAKPRAAEPPARASYPVENLPSAVEAGGGFWEIEVHYGSWSLDAVKSLFEKSLTKKVGAEIRDEVTDKLNATRNILVKSSYEQAITFDSGGSNYGAEIRFFPRGRAGSFSLGVALEKTRIRMDLAGFVKQNYSNGSSARVDSTAFIETEPFTVNVNFRWDFFPSSRVSPYFVFGFGFGAFKGDFGFSYTGAFEMGGASESVSDTQVKSVEDFIEEDNPNVHLTFFPLLQSSLGIKAEIYRGITLRVEAGFWNGLTARGGLAFRF